MRKWFECVPNISEGRREEVIREIADAIQCVKGVTLLDVESDRDHNRSVFTFAGPAEPVKETIYQVADIAIRRVDLRMHKGEHPRIGAVDVIPFVPLWDATVEDAVALAKEVGAYLASTYSLPIYFYEDAASAPHRRNLADIRQGEFEGLAEKMKKPEWKPDLGPEEPHPTAGATVVGARFFLIAYNIYLGTTDVSIAKKIAKAIRASNGGLAYVKALGFEIKERNLVQVSMNLVDYRKSPMHRVFELVRLEAERYGVPIVSSEIVGLVPLDAIVDAADHFLRLEKFSRKQILDIRLLEGG